MFIWIFIIVPVAIIAWVVMAYNSLVTMRNRVAEAWSDIDVQLKRRYDLIPNLVETVRGYVKHERDLFTEVTKARTAAMQAQAPGKKAEAENMISEALKSIFAVAENYPQLKASDNFAKLQDELSDTENKISAARRFYNGNVRDFNIKIQVFPSNLIANRFKFGKKELFEIENKSEKEPVKVGF